MMIDRSTMQTFLGCCLCLLFVANAKTAIVPPPWANPDHNPCAAQPRGWQLLYWPDDGKCYKIFQIGSPCPDTMELGPSATNGGVVAECRCPPGTAQSPRDALCHPIFTKASCPRGQYFAPVPEVPNSRGSRWRWGVCREPELCSERGQIFWPRTGKCYDRLSRGPCQLGQLLTLDSDNFAVCSCSTNGELGAFYWGGETPGCHEHYTKGPCSESGEIFLPGGICGCYRHLPHYHPPTDKCYPLGGIGPCGKGHQFIVTNQEHNETAHIHGKCICKPNHVLYKDNLCYRIHTRGPCDVGEMLINSTNCIPVPCKRGRLYFPREKTCYKIGTRGPCPEGQIVLYDKNVRPSIDGVSYNGICGCTNELEMAGKCNDDINPSCENTLGMFIVDSKCYKLYTQGPCGKGEWLIAQRRARNGSNSGVNNHDETTLWRDDGKLQRPKVRCECRPGYKRISERSINDANIKTNGVITLGECQPPTVTLAQFLNDNMNTVNY